MNTDTMVIIMVIIVMILMTATTTAMERVMKALHDDDGRLVGLVVKASASRAEGPGFESRLRRDFFRGRVIPVT